MLVCNQKKIFTCRRRRVWVKNEISVSAITVSQKNVNISQISDLWCHENKNTKLEATELINSMVHATNDQNFK